MYRACLLTPVPEPSTWVLLGVGMLRCRRKVGDLALADDDECIEKLSTGHFVPGSVGVW